MCASAHISIGNINIGMRWKPPISTPRSLSICRMISALSMNVRGHSSSISTKPSLPNAANCLTFLSFHKERKPIQASLPHQPSLQNRIIRCFSKSTALFPTFPLLTSSSTWVMKASSSCEIDSRRMMVFRNKEIEETYLLENHVLYAWKKSGCLFLQCLGIDGLLKV